MNSNDVVIAGSARTPMGGMMGSLSSVRSPDLGAISIKTAIERSGLQPADVQEVIMKERFTFVNTADEPGAHHTETCAVLYDVLCCSA